MRKSIYFLGITLFFSSVSYAQVTTNGGSGLAPTYASLNAAITALNGATITSPVVITLTGNETAPAGGYNVSKSGTAVNTITINGVNSTITAPVGTGTTDAIFKITGADYITLDGLNLAESASNATSNARMEYGYYVLNASDADGAQYNTIKNCKVTLNKANANVTIGVYQYANKTSAASTGCNSYNKYQYVAIENSALGFRLNNNWAAYTCVDVGNEISNCTIGGSSANDMGGATMFSNTNAAIRLTYQNNVNIFNNEIRNLTATNASAHAWGIHANAVSGTINIYNNKIHDIKGSSTTVSYYASGIYVEGTSAATFNINNNAIWNIYVGVTAATSSQLVHGLKLAATATYNIYFNSIRLDEDAYPSSSCIYLSTASGTTLLQDNILSNVSTAGATSKRYCIYKTGAGTYSSSSDYNDFYIASGTNNFVGYDAADKTTLTNWQGGTRDLNSVNQNPNFTSASNLRPTTGSYINGVAVSGITTDIEANTRAATPSMGAYEKLLVCTAPSSLTASGITSTSANLGWTENGTATAWDIEWGAAGFTQGAGTTISGTASNPYALSGLTAGNAYAFYVRASCGGGSYSSWVGPFNFSTCLAPSSIVVSAITPTTSTISWTAASPAPGSGYDYEIRTSGAGGTGATGLATSGTTAAGVVAANITGLSNATTYYVYVRSNCGSGAASPWIGPQSFVTICSLPTALTATSITSSSANLSWTENGSATTWDIEFGLNGFTPTGTPTVSGITKPYSKTGLTANTAYSYYVRSNCESGINSTWVGPYNFSTLASCAVPVQLSALSITATSANLTWVENGTATAWDIEYGASGFSQGTGTTITGTTSNPYSLSGLTTGNSYDYYVRSSCGGGSFSTWAGPYNFTASPSTVYITSSEGTAAGEYANLKPAFDRVNNGTFKGVVSITVGSADGQTITETAQAVLNKSGVGAANYSKVTISPAYANLKITSSLNGAATIQLNDAQNVIIDGRIGLTGTTVNLTIENSVVNASYGAVMFSGAQYDTIRYCNLLSSTTNNVPGYGTVSFLLNGAATSGSSYNAIEYCNISKSGANMPYNGIASSNGSSTYKSINNTVRNCTISDFKRSGIWLGNSGVSGYNEGWVIDNNTFYQSASFAIDGTVYSNHAIYIGYHNVGSINSIRKESGSFTITNNLIGGNGAAGKWTVTGNNTSSIIAGIYLSASTTDYSVVSGNTVKDFDVQTQYFYGICAQEVMVKIGTAAVGNSVYDITLNHTNGTDGGSVEGIRLENATGYACELRNNSVYNITATAGAANFTEVFGINGYDGSSVASTIYNSNKVYNLDVSKVFNYLYGIRCAGQVSQNHVSNLKLGSGSTMYGIYWMGSAVNADYRLENNEVILGLDAAGSSTALNQSIYGMVMTTVGYSYYNSVLLRGTATSGSSYCYRMGSNATGYVFSNNLSYNDRSGGTGKNYCLSAAFTNKTYLTASNNAYVLNDGSKASNNIGDWGGTDEATLANWTTASGETSSIAETSTNKPVATLFVELPTNTNLVPSDLWLKAGAVVVATFDKKNVARPNPGPTTMGAYENTQTLPVEIIEIGARKSGSNNLIEWKTASETNNDYFEVLKSVDVKEWKRIGTVKGAGNSNSANSYVYKDASSDGKGTVYYRLKQVDFDGKFSYSSVVSVNVNGSKVEIDMLYPVPANDVVYVTYHSTENGQLPVVNLYNVFGNVVTPLTAYKVDDNKIKIRLDDIPQGQYYLGLDFGYEVKTMKLIIVR